MSLSTTASIRPAISAGPLSANRIVINCTSLVFSPAESSRASNKNAERLVGAEATTRFPLSALRSFSPWGKFFRLKKISRLQPGTASSRLATIRIRAPLATAFKNAGIGLWDLSCAEVHDCFTIAELLIYEAMGLAKKGEGERVVAEGTAEKTGKLPINVSGGLKAKGHPIGATGVSMHVLQSMQLTGTAGDMQLKEPQLGGVFNMGGAAVANYVSILERLR